MVTWDNYEEYLIMEADGELDEAGRQALQSFIDANPALEEESASFSILKFQPDMEVVYHDHGRLLREEPKKGIALLFRPIALAAAAASVGVIIALSALWPRHDIDYTIVSTIIPRISIPTKHVPKDSVTSSLAVAPVIHNVSKVPSRSQAGARVRHHRMRQNVTDSYAALPLSTASSLKGADIRVTPMPADQAAVAIIDESGVTVNENASEGPAVRLATENHAAYNLLKQALAARVAQASSAAKAIKETALVIKLGKGSVNINF